MFPTLTIPTGKPLFSRREIPITRRTTCKSSSVQAFPETARRPLSLYEVLRVEHTASLTEIKTAYRSLAKMYHPDALNRSESESDGRDFIEIHNAYETLSDPAARAVYDLSLAAHQRRPSFGDSAVSRVGFYTTRSWETDQCW